MRKFGGRWSESKLNCVEDYIRSYLKVMQKQHWCSLIYIDAFAGSGKQALKSAKGSEAEIEKMDSFFGDESERAETKEFLIGSAIRALRVSAQETRSFDRFFLIDVDEPSCGELRSLVGLEFPEMIDKKVDIICGDANRFLSDFISSVDWLRTRALVFLDPCGLEVDWDLVTRITKTKACDVWYLFPLGGVTRLMKKDGDVPEGWMLRLDRVFGTDEWRRLFYRKSGQQSLFKENDESLYKDAPLGHLVDFIRRRFLAVFPAVSNAGILKNAKNVPLFALILGVSNPSPPAQRAALRIANHLVQEINKP
jgi:three-Cys-motif partner protein